MGSKSKKVISKALAFILIFTLIFNDISAFASDIANNRKIDVWDFGGIQTSGDLYNNNITSEILDSKTTIKSGTFVTTSFGDLAIANPDKSDRSYYSGADGTTVGVNSSGNWGPQKYSYDDGYNANGVYYANGTGGSGRRFLTLDHVIAGDKISVYGGTTNGNETIHFVHAAVVVNGTTVTVTPDASQAQDSSAPFTTTAQRVDFTAQYSGSYQIYLTAGAGGKPYFQRVVRTPGVKVNGKVNINDSDLSTGYALYFTNQTTGDKITVNVNADHTFDTVLATGYDYIATLKDITSHRFSDETKKVSTSTSDISIGKSVNLDVVANQLVRVNGKINGFDSSYNVSNLQIDYTPPAGSLASKVTATVNTKDMTYTADVQDGVDYTTVISGVNDYTIVDGGSLSVNADTIQDITVAPKSVHTATGKFQGLSSTAQISSITFTHVDDGYIYNGDVSNGGYTASLRDGAYSVTAVSSENYSTSAHVVMNGKNTTKDILFRNNTAPGPLAWVPDLYVGDSSKPNNYSTVKDALDAAARMNPTDEAHRITIHIAPGVYRAQLIIKTPYITLVNTNPNPTSDPSTQVKITWYYGIGYKYYSAGSDGFYNAENAFDKYSKNIVSKWGGTVYLTSTATDFKAKNIIFENSFNKYMTDEELADGVELANIPTASSINENRRSFTDVTSKAATERAAAIIIEGNRAEFENSSFIGSQDTLYTGGSGTNSSYFKNSYIEGNTDYIFGDGNVVFDNTILNFAGYSEKAVGGYITAAKDLASHGYLFRNSTITANSKYMQTSGFFGRPWGAGARVTFLNTKLQNSSIIDPKGWTDMTGTPENANYREYNTTYNNSAVDTSQRRAPVLTEAPADVIDVAKYFGDWTPSFYTADPVEVSITSIVQPADITVIEDGAVALPQTVTAVYSDGTQKNVGVTWDEVNTANVGVVDVHGAVVGFAAGVTIKVTVTAKPTSTPTIWIVGDSTVSSFSDNYYYPRYGWGTQIDKYLDGSFTINNLALSGRSSKSYTSEPEYKKLLSGMKSGDYLLVGFGHNDEKAEVDRYTNPNGTYQDDGSFANSLYENYIKPAEDSGTQVILNTPIVRRTATGVWSDSNLHITSTSGEFAGGDYSKAIKDLGETLKIPVVDLTSLTKDVYDQLGPEETLYMHAWTSSKLASVDNTHTNIWGGKYNAYLITREIKKLGISGLAEHVIDAEAPTKANTLSPNPNYVDSEYTGNLPQSTLWPDYGIWKGTVFGDVGGVPSTTNQTLGTDSNGSMHIAVANNKGKIASTADGIAMYYYKVPANSTFTLSAKAKVNSFSLNDQVSFGLMARDDMYIDSYMTSAMGDYVAAAPLKLTKGPSDGLWNSFARKSGVLTQGGTAVYPIAAGDTVDLRIEGNSDGYATTFGDEATITGGFDFKLTSIDSDYVYVGMFVARNADIAFSDIKLVVNGVEVTHEDTSTPTPDIEAPEWTNGTLLANQVTQTGLTLTWNEAQDNVGVIGYEVYEGSNLLTTVTGSVYSFDVSGLSSGTSYTFTVQAGDAAGNWSTDGPTVRVRTDAQESSSPPTSGDGGGTGTGTPPITTVPPNNYNPSLQPSAVIPEGAGIVSTPTVTVDKTTGVATASVNQTSLNNAITQAKADENGTKTVVIVVPKAEGATAYELKLPAAAVNDSQAAVKIAISTEVGTVVVPSNMLSNVKGSIGAKEITLTIARADVSKLPANVTSTIGSRPVVELNIAVDGKRVDYNNLNAPVTIAIPYKPTAEETKDIEHLVVIYIDEAGNLIAIPSGKYISATQEVTFTTTHFSKYAVGFVHKSFSDLTNYPWAEQEIGVMASKGIINGTSDATFTPGAFITRADFLHLLVKTLNLNTNVDTNFEDVDTSIYYYHSVGVAKKLGIADGIGGNQFNPKASIKRQDMMVFIKKALDVANKLKTIGDASDLEKFSDKKDIASYALESAATLVREGIIQGQGSVLSPMGNATRAETAVMMYRIYNK